jgi:hypothetical protein
MPPTDHQSLCKCAGDSDASDGSKGIVWELSLQGNVVGLVKLKMDWGLGKKNGKILHACSYSQARSPSSSSLTALDA